MIKRKVSNWERFVLIVNTMPNPEPVVYRKTTRGVPQVAFIAKNTDGICVYEYVAGGLLSMSLALSKLEELNTEVKEVSERINYGY